MMKSFSFCLALALLVPHQAWAQEEDDTSAGDDAAPAEDQPQATHDVKSATPSVPTSEVHVVQSGDTLWDLCSKVLNSPWYWPKIWSYNPQITNPHWIYPGNEL